MNLLKYGMGLVVAIALTACGGGGGSAGTTTNAVVTPPATPASTPLVTSAATPATVEVLASANTLPSAGAEVLITAFVKNGNNVGMSGQAVTFSATSGTLQASTLLTDASGAVTAKLIAGSDKSLRNITVTVTATPASGSIIIPVSDTRISIAGSGSLQAGGAAATYTVRAVDSSANPISDATIVVSSTLGNAISPASLSTDATGTASFLYTPNIAGADSLKISGLGASATTAVIVNSIDLVALSPASNTSIAIGSTQTITVRYKNLNVGVPNQTVAFSTTRGTFVASSATTDVNGDASAVLSSTTAGPAVIVAQISGVGQVNLTVQFVATTPSTIVVQSNPGAVLPNSAGTSVNQSSIEAVVRDANGNAVANRQVNFTTLLDISNGTLSPGVATTDANGRAQVQFIPGATSTPANGVIIQATVASTAITSTTTLTVNGKALFITIAFGNTISNVDETTYSKPFSVYVTDANGVAVGNQLLTLSVIPEEYYKGFLEFKLLSATSGVWTDSETNPAVTCVNEDVNRNGVLDAGEDTNVNAQLTPGNVAVAAPGSVTTDASGRASFSLQYGEQFAPWVKARISARASVAGTESTQSILYSLTGSSADFTAQTVPPAGVNSPFGTSTSCTNSN